MPAFHERDRFNDWSQNNTTVSSSTGPVTEQQLLHQRQQQQQQFLIQQQQMLLLQQQQYEATLQQRMIENAKQTNPYWATAPSMMLLQKRDITSTLDKGVAARQRKRKRRRKFMPEYILAREGIFDLIDSKAPIVNPLSSNSHFFPRGKDVHPSSQSIKKDYYAICHDRVEISVREAKAEFDLKSSDLASLTPISDLMASVASSASRYLAKDVADLAMKRQEDKISRAIIEQKTVINDRIERIKKADIVPSRISEEFYDRIFGEYFDPMVNSRNLMKFSLLKKLAQSAEIIQTFLPKRFWRQSLLPVFVNVKPIFVKTHYPQRLYALVAKSMELSRMYIRVMEEAFVTIHSYLDKDSLDNLLKAHGAHPYFETIEMFRDPQKVKRLIERDVSMETGDSSWLENTTAATAVVETAMQVPYDPRIGKAFAVRQLVYFHQTTPEIRKQQLIALFEDLHKLKPDLEIENFENHLSLCSGFIDGTDMSCGLEYLAAKVFVDRFLISQGAFAYDRNSRWLQEKLRSFMFERRLDMKKSVEKVVSLELRDSARRAVRSELWELFHGARFAENNNF